MEFDKISKYPVSTEKRNYLVDVERERIAHKTYQFIVTVFVKRKNPRWWQRKFVMVRRISSGWESYDKISVDLIGFVTEEIADMERDFSESLALRDKQAKALAEYKEWGGDLR